MNKKALIPVIIFVSIAIGFFLGRIIYKPNNIFYAQNKDFKQLQTLIDIIQENYSDQINVFDFLKKDLTNAISRIDPYSSFFTKDEYKNYENHIDGYYKGIGIQYFIFRDTITILKVFKNSPAAKCNLQALDQIIKFNNDTVINLALDSLSKLFKLTNKKITLTIEKFKSGKTQKITIQKTEVNIPQVEACFVNDSTVYFKIKSFSSDVYTEFQKKEKSLLAKHKIANVIIDLRDNPGGLLSSAVNIADEFFDKNDTIVKTLTKNNIKKIYISTSKGLLKNTKIIVLVNSKTASAAELLSLAFQDNDRALIIGTQTFGKGVFQQDFSVQNDIAHITTGKYFGPSGRWINFKKGKIKYFRTKNGRYVCNLSGISPDVYCNFPNLENIFNFYDNYICAFIIKNKEKFKNITNKKIFSRVYSSIDTSELPDITIRENFKQFNLKNLDYLFLEKILLPDSVGLKDFLIRDSCYLKAMRILKKGDLKKIMFRKDTLKAV